MAYSVLIVDDSRPMRSAIIRTLKRSGYARFEIFEAENGVEALKLLESAWIDLIMTDYNMPEMNGLEFIHAVKANPNTKEIPLVLISAEENESRSREFKKAGAAAHITKQITAPAIRKLLVSILGKAGSEDRSGKGF